jgi:hypothetical protein
MKKDKLSLKDQNSEVEVITMLGFKRTLISSRVGAKHGYQSQTSGYVLLESITRNEKEKLLKIIFRIEI